MDTGLQNLVAQLEKHGLTVASCDPENQIQVTNPKNCLLAEEIALRGGRYIMASIDYEIGEHGQETTCAERIARILAVATTSQEAGP
jgi:hypothetical protein